MRPNFELLRRAFEIIDGIPEHRFNLSRWTSGLGSENNCGTIACAGGWLMRHPEFNARGLSERAGGAFEGFPEFKGDIGLIGLANLFGLSGPERQLFSERSGSFLYFPRADLTVSDKTVFLRRIIKLLDHYGQHVDAAVRARVFA